MRADRTQDDLLGPRCALGYLSRRHAAWFDLTDDETSPRPARPARRTPSSIAADSCFRPPLDMEGVIAI